MYNNLLTDTRHVTPRVLLTKVSLDLFRQRPVFGQGYATFDQVKLTVPVPAGDELTLQTTTSHDTFLTVLAELGVIGLVLLVVPWVVIGWRAIEAGWRASAEPWLVGGCIGAAGTYAIGA